jgi:uncharacterized protein (DUF1810 family)
VTSSFDLERFVLAQASVYPAVCAELRRGRKTSHWMWFIFPQIAGLGHSPMAHQYAITCRAEAAAYLDHRVLGMRLRECTRLVNGVQGRSLFDIFGTPDDMKFRSSMTLFAEVARQGDPFAEALDKYCESASDALTLELRD